ncbi:Sporulation-specific N-acetylmuramoyl-L-alanine amidase [Fervidicola ferrireducens]|uniref:Sporulation-specific N-acetylmuramoyl-L-alanine amidase n=1 Tax=Fervidicola ferrireducens TaxID=520764 RepID=A0A140LCX3_9FIRM|nr:N-acetylmuramoyl-L-alanine amidase [Fervidicola ferrireducens]KXG78398.1 Sporulation-specific N-acetylmuramoyl-L-alanine amidase [Fervidicola ferrireducens]
MKFVRNIFSLVIAIVVLISAFNSEAATAQQAVFFIGAKRYVVNGQSIEMDSAPFIQEGRTFVPLRFLAYALGVPPENIHWSDESRTATLSKDGVIVTTAIGKKALYINGRQVKTDVAPVIIPPGRICLPARYIAEAFGHKVHWNASARTVTITISTRRAKVVIDPGHGGHDPGAVANSLRESDITLDLALKVAQELEQLGFDVRLTREDDRYISLEGRAALANQWDADLFVSLHCNAASNPAARGFESYIYSRAQSSTRELARKIHERLAAFLYQFGVPDRGIKEANFYVLRETKSPATLLECLFITNSEDAKLLQDVNWRSRLASEIAQAVAAALSS